MRQTLIYILLIFIISLWGCSSVVRFSDNNYAECKYPAETPVKKDNAKQKQIETAKNKEDNGDLIIYKNNTQKSVLEEAEKWLGTPYRYGGTDKRGVDCSGLTYNVFLSVGTVLPRTAEQQYMYTKRISRSELEVGDLIFFTNRGKISHVGIYSGNNTMIHSSSSSGVIRQKLDSYNGQTVAGYGRP